MTERKGIEKVREGLVLLIDGMIDMTDELVKEGLERQDVRDAINYRLDLIEGYLADAHRYRVPGAQISSLDLRYKSLKSEVGKK